MHPLLLQPALLPQCVYYAGADIPWPNRLALWQTLPMLTIAVGIVVCLFIMGWAQMANESRPGWWQKPDAWTISMAELIESDDRWLEDGGGIRHPNGTDSNKLLELAPSGKSRHLLAQCIARKLETIREAERRRAQSDVLRRFIDG